MPAKKTALPGWEAPPLRKPRADSKLKNLPREDQEVMWHLMHPDSEGGDPWTLEAVAVHVLNEHGFEPALSSLSEWRRWFALNLRVENAAAAADQAREEVLAKDPNMTPEDLNRVAQQVFTAETMQAGDVKGYVALAKLQLTREKHALERQKLEASTKTKLEAGLDALLAEIQGNPAALEIWNQLKEALSK